ncbi:hypothetical protein [Candidatus Palauibacter polyketidifaciens]|uniref:hypothetical protein n=1 Tax=Candidatus Palauibacter polyketidifaciens TaxID=3056740 RepID=UPI002382EF14|nr:hypothetical protein [Candidatus Palauibacter polyketidifaciens]MDE2720200.1 hypothetical protein [Candidatus Palauibacter polyketidifaciens]
MNTNDPQARRVLELEGGIRNWRTTVERSSSLSARELDELEDHLRARVSLELELNPVLAPAEALAIAREGLGQPKMISSEFARAGQPRWRRVLWAAWALYAASFLLPTLVTSGVVSPSGGVVDFTAYGYEFFVRVFREGELGPPLLVLILNSPMLMTLPVLWRSRRWKMPWPLLGSMGVGALGFGALSLGWPPTIMADGGGGPGYLGPGYWAWSASFVCAAVALRFRKRDWASARPKQGIA